MANLIYIAGSLSDYQRARRAMQAAQHLGWVITHNWTLDPMPALQGEGAVSQKGLASQFLQAIHDCDVFLQLSSGRPSRGRERELGAALMLNQMGWGKRILISRRDTRSSPVDYAAAGTPWDEMCEIYPDDFAALAGLGTPTLTAGNGVGTPNKKVGVAVIVRNEHGHYLMHKRLSGASGNKGKWGAPGGQLEYGETVLGAAVREFREETGCVLFDAAIEVVTEASDWVCFVVQGHYTGAPVRPDSERAKAEEWCWLSASQLVESRLRGEVSSGLDSWIDGTEIARGLASQVDRGPLNTRTVRLP